MSSSHAEYKAKVDAMASKRKAKSDVKLSRAQLDELKQAFAEVDADGSRSIAAAQPRGSREAAPASWTRKPSCGPAQ